MMYKARKKLEAHFKPLLSIKHENILKLYGVTHDKMQSYLIMEYARCGTLYNCIHDKLNVNEFRRTYKYKDILSWMLQCAKVSFFTDL